MEPEMQKVTTQKGASDMINKIIMISSLVLILGCHDTHKSRQKFVDPYLDSFRGKGIKHMISFSPDEAELIDTVTFDSSGNIVTFKSFGVTEFRVYDSLNFLTKKLTIDDSPENYLIHYIVNDDGYLIQEWNTVNSLNLRVDDKDIGDSFKVIVFELDNSGRVKKEIDSTLQEYSVYIYAGQNLIEKVIHSSIDDSKISSFKYLYSEDDELTSIQFLVRNNILFEHYFSSGLLDSSVYFDKGIKLKHSYIYY